MNLQLTGQHIAIFGAASGIGQAIAHAFATEEAIVHGFDRAEGERVRFVGDVTDLAAVQAFVTDLPQVDHAIFCVGVGSGKFGFPFWNLEPRDWARVLEINLIGAVNVAHACAPRLIERGEGSMQFLVSVAGQIGSQTDPPYSAAKAGLINFTQCAAKDLAPHGIRVNALSPGMVKTALNHSVWQSSQARLPAAERQDYDTWAAEKIRKVSPLGRWQSAEELAALSVYLASPHARNITGQTLNVDGGQVMHA